MTGIVNTLKELKIRGISISLPGHGFSSNHPSRKIGDWPHEDVRPVFEKENIRGNFMVEGMSFGSSHAMAVMHEFPGRVTRTHLLVPYLPVEIRRQENWKLYGQDDAFRCEYPWASSCWPRTCCLFCCCSMCFNCCGAAQMAVSETKKFDNDVGYPLSRVQAGDIKHAHAASIHGFIYNALAPTTSMNWGFSPKETDVSSMRILVSYGASAAWLVVSCFITPIPHNLSQRRFEIELAFKRADGVLDSLEEVRTSKVLQSMASSWGTCICRKLPSAW